MNTLVEARDVRKNYGQNEVLRGIDLEVARGEVLCIIGPSGAGKSTFLRCVNHLERLDGGSIRVAGELIGYRVEGDDLRELHPKDVAAQCKSIGMVFQQFNLFPHKTALENVMLAPRHVLGLTKSDARECAMSHLERVGLASHATKRPAALSGGQQQRVAIARALAMRPQLMLFDEPTSALDPELVGEVLDAMRALAADGMTMIVVSHEMGFTREAADKVAFMAEGRIVEAGPPATVLGAPEHSRTRAFLSMVK